MTDSNRSPGFKIPRNAPAPQLKMFFGHGDYVIAESAAAASCCWTEHFDASSYAKEFVEVPELAFISIRVIDGIYGLDIAEAGMGYIETAGTEYWIFKFGAGYLASTKGD